MAIVRLGLGFICFLLGLGYLFRPTSILHLYAYIRANILKDSDVLLHNKRIGILLLLTSFILLTIATQSHS